MVENIKMPMIEEIRRNNARSLLTPGERIKDFAEKINRSAGQASHLIGSGSSKDIGKNLARHIEKCYKKPVGWLDTNHTKIIIKGNQADYDISNTQPAPSARGFVPVISWIKAGEWHEAEEYAPQAGDEALPCPISHGVNTYALRVVGDSMTHPSGRSYPEGAVIYVDPDQSGDVVAGSRIIAKLKGEGADVTFKELAYDGTLPYLKPLNPNHKPVWDEFEVIGKVIGMWMHD